MWLSQLLTPQEPAAFAFLIFHHIRVLVTSRKLGQRVRTPEKLLGETCCFVAAAKQHLLKKVKEYLHNSFVYRWHSVGTQTIQRTDKAATPC